MSVVGPFPTFRPDDLGWTPASEASLLGWWKADSLSLSNNDPVSSWSDSSASGYTMTQTTPSQKPTYKTNIKNGLPAVSFDATQAQLLQSSMPSDTKPFTVAAVIESAHFSTNYQVMFGSNANGDLLWFTRITADNAMEVDAQNTALIAAPTTTFTDGNWYVIIFNYDTDGTWVSRVNGSALTSTNNVSFTGASTTVMGAKGDTGFAMWGYIAEIMKFSSVVSTATIDTYLNGRWAVH